MYCCFRQLRVVEMIRMTTHPIDPDALRRELFNPAAGGYCALSRAGSAITTMATTVRRLEYEGYEPVAANGR